MFLNLFFIFNRKKIRVCFKLNRFRLSTKNISFVLSWSTISCSLLDTGLALICVVWVSEEARWSYSQQWGRFLCRRAWLVYEWRTILSYPLLQPPPFWLPWVFHQHPIFSSAGVVSGGWMSGGSRMGAKRKANDLQSTWRSICSASLLGRLWMWQSQLCWECEPLLCQGPEKPTTLFKEIAVRGPSATLCLSISLSLAQLKSPFFLCKEW